MRESNKRVPLAPCHPRSLPTHLSPPPSLTAWRYSFSEGGLKAAAVNLPLKERDAVVAAVLSACGLKLECLRMAWEDGKIGAGDFASKL